MSLSQKTLELDTIIVETLFNRGVPLSTSQTYMPIVSYVGAYIPPPTYTEQQVFTEQRTFTEEQLVITPTLVPNVTTLGSVGNDGIGKGSYGVCLDNLGNLYVADYGNNRICIITVATGNLTTLAGSVSGFSNDIGTNARFNTPSGVCLDNLGNLYVTDSVNNRIRKINIATSNVTTFAGSGTGFSNGIGTNARFNNPEGVCVDNLGNLYVADRLNNRIRKINIATSNVTTLAGSGVGFSNDIGTNARFYNPEGVCVDNLGNLYVSERFNHSIRKINIATSNVTTLAGSVSGFSNDIGTNARFNTPSGVCVDNLGNLYVADYDNYLIRKINIATSNVTTFAGSGVGFSDGIATNAKFNSPRGITIDTLGNLYISDRVRIRKIDTYTSNYQTVTVNCNVTTYSTVTVNCNVTVSQDPTCPCCPWSAPIRGNMLTWSYLPVSTIYDSYFHGINPINLVNTVLLYQQGESAALSSLQLCLDTIVTLSNTTLSTFVTLCNMNSSTISSYTSSLRYYDALLPIPRYNTINTTCTNTSTIAGDLMSTFFMVTFASNTTVLLEIGDYYYLQRPIPLPVPVPWYWQGNPSRYIGPGLSSIYTSTLCNVPLMNSYWAILSNTSTAWVNSNTIIQTYNTSYAAYANTLIHSIDTGSSISSVFYSSNSFFIDNNSTFFYGNDVSTISTYVQTYFNSYLPTVPTNGPYISTGASSMYTMNSTLNSTLLSYISSGTLGDPLSTFSTIADFQLTDIFIQMNSQQGNTTLSTLNSNLSTYLLSVANLLSLSTNVAGYHCLSTLYYTEMSSVSTFYGQTVPYFLTSNILYNASTLLSTTLGISSYVDWQRSSLFGLISNYNAAPGASSLNLYLSTNISTSYYTYSSQVSSLSTLLQVSTVAFTKQLQVATVYYSNIKPMLNYSTTRYVYPGTANTSQYILRSTSFTAIELRSTVNCSSITVSSLGLAATVNTNAACVIQGAVNILQVDQSQPSLMLSNFNMYASDSIGPVPGHSIISQLSSIVFNSTFTIKHLYNSTLTGLVGINTTTPEYALDIGAGDARKLSGTTWINPSDERIKENIVDVEYQGIVQEISSLRLVMYTWSEEYRLAHDLMSTTTIGFLSQEVEAVFPKAVTRSLEEGFDDFRTLNTDQIMKSKFGLTQHLLYRYSTLQSRVNNLI